MRKIIPILLLFLCCSQVSAKQNENDPKHILVLHSYHQSMGWIKNINQAINDVLKPSENDYVLHIENMDTKRINTPEYLQQLKETYRLKYQNIKLDLILSSDNNAFDFLIKNRDEIFGNIPVAFSGVNDFKDSDLAGVANFTGVAEFFDAKSTVETALKLYPQANEVFVINDYLKTGRAWERTIKEQLGGISKDIKISYAKDSSIQELQQTISSLSNNTIVLLGVYFKDNSGNYFTYEKIGEAISSKSTHPVFCLLKFNLNNYVVGGNVISGYSQGEAMSQMAKDILSGTPISTIAVKKTGVTEYIFDYNGLRKFNMDLSKLPQDATILNQPESFFEHNKKILFTALFLIIALLIVIITLVISNKRIQRIVEEKIGNFKLLFMSTPSPLCHVSASGEILMFNNSFKELLGYDADDIPTLSQWWALAYPNEKHRQQVMKSWNEAVKTSTVTGEEIKPAIYNLSSKSGDIKIIEISGASMGLEFIATFTDLTERIQAENSLKASNDKLRGLFEMSPLGIALTDMNGTYIEFNHAFSKICGYTADELKALDYWELTPKKYMDDEVKQLEMLQKTGFYGPYEKEYIQKNGSLIPINLNGMIVTEPNGGQFIWSIIEDISDRKKNQKILEHIAHYDALTNLPNRTLFADRLQQAMRHTHRSKQKVIIAYLDLDGFKAVNDTYGHDIGDKLLIEVSQRMKRTVREEDSIARLGGDEFVILLSDFKDVISSLEIVNRLLETIANPIQINKLSLNVSVSIGLTFYPQTEEVDADQLLRQSDQAMYQAKLEGKNRYYILNPDKDMDIRERNVKLKRIEIAIENDEFVLYYQPKVNLRTGKVIGVEALIRWEHPDQGLLSPAFFLPDLEGDQLYIKLDEMVIKKVLSQMSSWIKEGLDISVSINISAIHIQQQDFVVKLQEIISKYKDVPASKIELEILETSSISNMEHVSEVVTSLKKIGIDSALDDFGTGYSSLSYLRQLPVQNLKIDQTFVRDMLDDPENFAIVDGVIRLASAFNRDVIAEGVEHKEHGDFLLALGCELAQGYVIAKPMPASDFPLWLRNWKTESSWSKIDKVKADNLNILYAKVEHRAWVKRVDNFINGKMNGVIEIHENECRFGNWLNSMELSENGDILKKIRILHSSIHLLANEMIALNNTNQNDKALSHLPHLYDLRDQLLKEVDLLL